MRQRRTESGYAFVVIRMRSFHTPFSIASEAEIIIFKVFTSCNLCTFNYTYLCENKQSLMHDSHLNETEPIHNMCSILRWKQILH